MIAARRLLRHQIYPKRGIRGQIGLVQQGSSEDQPQDETSTAVYIAIPPLLFTKNATAHLDRMMALTLQLWLQSRLK